MIPCLNDTNILLRFADKAHPQNPAVRKAMRKLKSQGYRLVTTPQNCTEFWNVATRPLDKNGLGLSLEDAKRQLKIIERAFSVMLDVPEIYAEWKKIVFAFGVSGAKVHDARLVAIMRSREINHILSFNTSDFIRYAPLGIVALDPVTL